MPTEVPASEPCLLWRDRKGADRRLILTDRIFLGRVCRGFDRDKCILVSDPMVSRDHAVIRLSPDGVEITDLSKNGTWINDVRMAPGASQRLEDGDHITIGDMRFRLACPHMSEAHEEDVWTEQTAISPSDVSITSLVADVRGFSALSQKAESAVVYSMIKEIFAQFSDIVIAHHGTVKDYVGDAVFAFWEHPGDYSAEHALSACRAALDQWRRVPEIHRQLLDRGVALPLPVLGWGMATGRITLSHFGSRSADLALVGDCINLAFRLSSMANKTLRSPIVMCRQTAALVEQTLPLVDLDNQDIRGRSGQERLFGIKLN